jgi:uncharacterized protein
MDLSILDLYDKLKHKAVCLDLEFTGMNKAISLAGIYKPSNGVVKCESYLRGKDLTKENLKKSFKGSKILITFNGNSSDIPMLEKEFPGVLPKDIISMDLYLIAKDLGLNTNLKVLENTLGIDRLNEFTKRRRIAAKLWKKYSKKNNKKALELLIEYNKQDTINLYPIAEKLVEIAHKKLKKKN